MVDASLDFGNIFAEELTGLTDDQVVALCARHLADKKLVVASALKSIDKQRRLAGPKDEQQWSEDSEDASVDKEAEPDEVDDAGMADDPDETSEGEDAEDEEGGSVDDGEAMFKGGELDEAEQAEMLEMEAEEAEDDDSDDEERMLAKFEREDLPFDSLKFDDFIDKDKQPGDLPPDEEDEDLEEHEKKNKMDGRNSKGKKKADDGASKSKFEKSQDRLRQEIATLEDSLVNPAPWQLRGEIEAAERPDGGLLEEDLDFDHIGRPRPLATEDLEEQLQELVKSRVKEGTFDSVTRKQKPVEQPAEYRKALLLDSEKPKPLSELYEQEFAKQQAAMEVKSQPKHEEIRRDLNTLLARLDRLSGLHFAPQNPLPRVRVVSGAPALAMEEVRGTAAPVAEGSQMAPEQAAGKPGKRAGREVGESEETRTDRLRRRRKAKARVRARLQRVAEKGTTSGGDSRAAALAQLKQQAKKPGSRVRILAS